MVLNDCVTRACSSWKLACNGTWCCGWVVQGATDGKIVRRLSISIKTVNKHVASVLSKTGSTNRTAAAAFALRHGLS